MDLKTHHLGAISIGISLLNVAMVIAPYWIHIDGQRDVGVFDSLTNDNAWVKTKCTEYYSETECGYLKSSQVSSIVTILFGFLAAAIYFLPPRTFSSLPSFMGVSASCGQFIFALMTTVIMHYFRSDYFDDDGVNREDDATGEDSFGWAYYLWIFTTVTSFLVMLCGYSLIYRIRFDTKERV